MKLINRYVAKQLRQLVFPKCRDHDDQVFLALAFHAKVDALVSRDRALLALRRKVRKFGVTIINVEELAS